MDSPAETHFFTTIIRDSAPLRPARVPQPKKRKRAPNQDHGETSAASGPEGQGDTTDVEHVDETSDTIAARTDPFFYPFDTHDPAHTTIDIEDVEQSRTAGLDPEDPVPAPPFPHRSKNSRLASRDYLPKPRHLISILGTLKPPIHISGKVRSGNVPTSLRAHHVGVLTTLMLRCAQDGDWQRAGKAWALLVRTRYLGDWVDVRTNGFWGLGAEILMQRSKETVDPPNTKNKRMTKHPARRRDAGSEQEYEDDVLSDDDRSSREGGTRSRAESPSGSDSGHEGPPERPQKFFTSTGFRQARNYYDRLIVQHPQQRINQPGVMAPEFYPAMLSLWVYEVCELSRRRKWELGHPAPKQQRDYGGYDGVDGMDEDEEEEDEGQVRDQRRAEQLADIAREDLRQARLICSRLDELLLSPPYDANAYLLELRGHVGVWVGDLLVDAVPPSSFAASTGDEDDDEEMQDPETAEARRDAQQEQAEELENAREYFLRAKEAGGTLATTATEIIERPFYGAAARAASSNGESDGNTGATTSRNSRESDGNAVRDIAMDG